MQRAGTRKAANSGSNIRNHVRLIADVPDSPGRNGGVPVGRLEEIPPASPLPFIFHFDLGGDVIAFHVQYPFGIAQARKQLRDRNGKHTSGIFFCHGMRSGSGQRLRQFKSVAVRVLERRQLHDLPRDAIRIRSASATVQKRGRPGPRTPPASRNRGTSGSLP